MNKIRIRFAATLLAMGPLLGACALDGVDLPGAEEATGRTAELPTGQPIEDTPTAPTSPTATPEPPSAAASATSADEVALYCERVRAFEDASEQADTLVHPLEVADAVDELIGLLRAADQAAPAAIERAHFRYMSQVERMAIALQDAGYNVLRVRAADFRFDADDEIVRTELREYNLRSCAIDGPRPIADVPAGRFDEQLVASLLDAGLPADTSACVLDALDRAARDAIVRAADPDAELASRIDGFIDVCSTATVPATPTVTPSPAPAPAQAPTPAPTAGTFEPGARPPIRSLSDVPDGIVEFYTIELLARGLDVSDTVCMVLAILNHPAVDPTVARWQLDQAAYNDLLASC